jgi:hypothetical protein
VLTYPEPSPDELARAVEAWTADMGGPVFYVADELGPWPGAAGWSAAEVDRTAWVAPAPASRSALPPRPGNVGLEYMLLRIERGSDQDAR